MDAPFQIRYAANLDIGDSFINVTNSGASGAGSQSGTSASITGSICVNIYAFSPDEQMGSCCSCVATPGELARLSVSNDLSNNILTPAVPKALVIKLLATVPVGGTCSNSAALPGTPAAGMLAWGTTTHTTPSGGTTVTETPFTPATLSADEQGKLTQLCSFIVANGSGFGVCRGCGLGGLGAQKR